MRAAGSPCPTLPPDRDFEWSEAGVEGAWRFTQRLYRLVMRLNEGANEGLKQGR